MAPLDPAAARLVRSWLGPPETPGLLALRHALADHGRGLWVDDPRRPGSVALVRGGDGGRFEAFGAGEPEPAVAWLVGRGRGFRLVAPASWADALPKSGGATTAGRVETWTLGPGSAAFAAPGPAARRLSADDADAFAAVAPGWSLRGWRSFGALIGRGAAFGVPHGTGFAALAWVFDRAGVYDSVGVATDARFRRLGLGRAAASALVRHLTTDLGRVPLWSAPAGNLASLGLARVLGFRPSAVESVVRWAPQPSSNGVERGHGNSS